MNCYVYFHIRKDTNSIFYVGKGTVYKEDLSFNKIKKSRYRRAFKKDNRSKWWNNVVSKSGYYVKIVKEDMSEPDANELEIFLISEIGKQNLVNLTSGGEGLLGRKVSNVTKEKIRKSALNRKLSGKRNPNAKKLINTKSKKIFFCCKTVSKNLGMPYGTFISMLRGDNTNTTDYVYFEKYDKNKKYITEVNVREPKIKVIDNNTGLKYESIATAVKNLKLSASTVYKSIKRKGSYKQLEILK